MKPSQRLSELKINLPALTPPVGSYVPGTRVGNLIYTSGQIPLADGKIAFTGKVGAERTLEEGQAAARMCALNALGIVADIAGGIDNVGRIVRLAVFVNSAPGFTDQPKVANGASDLMIGVFGDAGRHVRAAVGAAELPLNATVEVEMVAELRTGATA